MAYYSTWVIKCVEAHKLDSGLAPIVRNGYGMCKQPKAFPLFSHYFMECAMSA